MPKGDFTPEKRIKGIFIHVLEFMDTLVKIQNNYFNVKKVRNLRLEHFKRYSSFSYYTNSIKVYFFKTNQQTTI